MFHFEKCYVHLTRMSENEIANCLHNNSGDDDTDGEDFDSDFDSEDEFADPDWNNDSNFGLITTETSTTENVPILQGQRKRKRSNSIEEEFQEDFQDEFQEEDGEPNTSSTGQFTGTVNEIRNDSSEYKKLKWEKKNLQVHVNEVIFRGKKEMPDEIAALITPYDYFEYFVSQKFMQELVDQMNLYARQINVETQFNTNIYEVRKFIGILFLMSVFRYPNIRAYWGKHAFSLIANTMTVKRFELLRKFLHFNDNNAIIPVGEPGHDKLHRVRPLIKHFNERFGSVPMRQRLCVDEQMCATKMGGNPTRQYMPAKPHKWGTKLFVLCDSTRFIYLFTYMFFLYFNKLYIFRFSYTFEIYTGAGDNVIIENVPDLGASSNVVTRLSAKIPDNANHILYFDNFYTSLGLLIYLRSRGIYSLGTLRANRVPNIKLSSDAELTRKKVERGYSEEYVANAFGINISNVLWRDNKTVRLLSTYVGVKPFISHQIETPILTSKRWDRKTKQKVDVDCPFIIKEYNRHMGGVDLMDGLIGRYHIRMKTRKWTNKLFFHMLDMAMVNAYILYNRLHPGDKKELQNFRIEVAESMCLIDQCKKKGRPLSSTTTAENGRQMAGTKTYIPTAEVQFDGIDHWCIFLDRSGKKTCKFFGCKSETQAFCTKCKVNLCNSTSKSCFYEYHQRQQLHN